ncbi:MAG: alpha-glucan family phosphorylase [Deltaproteobacteria bacterium]|nr:alpha-glucan family phosphorylase [Deltaproteobacteria bacterium]
MAAIEASPAPDPLDGLLSRVPPALAPLARLAFNYWWSWQPEGESLFRDVDPERWASCERNPVRLLSETMLLDRAAGSDLPGRSAAALARLEAELAAPALPTAGASAEHPIAYFSAEFGIHGSLPVYAGGLGVLAGDLLKQASDLRMPLVGVGLFYRRGYFHQRLDLSGLQHEFWTEVDPDRLPMRPVRSADGSPVVVRVALRGHDVALRLWRVDVGRVPLLLLDSNVPGNTPVDHALTSQLYVAERDMRLMQYAALGIGGIRALRALSIDASIVHLNEGHAALAPLEMARGLRARGASFAEAIAATRASVVFTTHTPVPAGNERYEASDLRRILPGLCQELDVSEEELLQLGRLPGDGHESHLGMTELGLHASRTANAVSRRHGEVARAMWQDFFPGRSLDEVPITHVTNGVHLATWMRAPMRELLRRHLGDDWESVQSHAERWERVSSIPDEELWQVRNTLRAELVETVRRRSVRDRLDRGEPIDYVEAAARTFDEGVLTVGFARRVATYKRLHLLTQSPERALGLLGSDRPIQVVIAGKAHPLDEDAKHFVQTIFAMKRAPGVGTRVAFLEDYDMDLARTMVAGCDVWVNMPRPPNEASGTSGMKAVLNGTLHLSVLDGWWSEAFDGSNGWGIESPEGDDPFEQDRRDADRLYSILESEAVPDFYQRDPLGLPRAWLQRIKRSLVSLGPRFNSMRMLEDYTARVYSR